MEIFYAGPKPVKEVKGMVFPRLTLVDVPADTARGLLTAKPRVFFTKGEQVPVETLLLRYYQYDRVVEEFQQMEEQYFALAATYTDPKDRAKKDGALEQVKFARDRIAEAHRLQDEVRSNLDEAIEAEQALIASFAGRIAETSGATDRVLLEAAMEQVSQLKQQLSGMAELQQQLSSMAAIAQQMEAMQQLVQAQAKELEALKAEKAPEPPEPVEDEKSKKK